MAEILVARSLDQVWSVFTDVATWKTWWGGDLKSVTPDWRSGAKMTWGGGSQATVVDFIERKRVNVKGSYGEKLVWTFSSAAGGGTSVSMADDLGASGLVATSAAAREDEFVCVLRKLKNLVESRARSSQNSQPASR